MFRKYSIAFLAGALGGILALLAIVRLGGSTFFVAQLPYPTVSPTPTPTSGSLDHWQRIVADAAVSTVLVQTFGDNRLARQGSGAVVSSDGLIVTTADVAASGAFVYQVVADDKILRARVVARDARRNLALFAVDADGLTVADFDSVQNYQSGGTYIVVGKTISVTAPAIFSQRAMVSYVTERETVLDTALNYFMSGAKVVDANGRVAGIVAIRSSKVSLIPSRTVIQFLENYLSAKGISR